MRVAGESLRERLVRGWMAIVGRFGHVQTLVMLGFLYTFLIGPVALIAAALGRDLLGKRLRRGTPSAWLDADSSAPSLERAKLQA